MENKDKTDNAIAYARRLFTVRPRSERELRDRLLKKGFERDNVSEAISFLKEKKIINDLGFAKLWVESRMHTNPKGHKLLQKELRGKGVSDSVIEKVLAEKEEDEDSVVRAIAAQKSDRLKSLPKHKARKKLFDFLARRGFDFDVIESAVKELFD
ncbi:MAG: hypothetical protein A2Z72_07125 [Omnitrophica bacterium RBG_13_46_9]|nr:MAG: hypothetical protein A2Z72_07125 [Omnitrophica bacterium RBG_13_46_9]